LVRVLHEKRTSLAASISAADAAATTGDEGALSPSIGTAHRQCEEAWQVLMTPGRVKDQAALTHFIEDNGLMQASDLENLIDAGELSLLATITATVQIAGALKFKKCMCMT